MINAITGASAEAANAASISDSSNGLGQDAFLQLLVAQVRYQNPLDPSDSQEFLAQTAQFTMVESLEKLMDAQNEALAFQRASLSANLLGAEVTGEDALTGAPVSGRVEGVLFNAGQPRLIVDGHQVDMSTVTEAVLATVASPPDGPAPVVEQPAEGTTGSATANPPAPPTVPVVTEFDSAAEPPPDPTIEFSL